jgi:hypothetical protein
MKFVKPSKKKEKKKVHPSRMAMDVVNLYITLSVNRRSIEK